MQSPKFNARIDERDGNNEIIVCVTYERSRHGLLLLLLLLPLARSLEGPSSGVAEPPAGDPQINGGAIANANNIICGQILKPALPWPEMNPNRRCAQFLPEASVTGAQRWHAPQVGCTCCAQFLKHRPYVQHVVLHALHKHRWQWWPHSAGENANSCLAISVTQ